MTDKLPATLRPGTELRYKIRDADRELVLDLKPLSGLHLAPPAEAASSAVNAEGTE